VKNRKIQVKNNENTAHQNLCDAGKTMETYVKTLKIKKQGIQLKKLEKKIRELYIHNKKQQLKKEHNK